MLTRFLSRYRFESVIILRGKNQKFHRFCGLICFAFFVCSAKVKWLHGLPYFEKSKKLLKYKWISNCFE